MEYENFDFAGLTPEALSNKATEIALKIGAEVQKDHANLLPDPEAPLDAAMFSKDLIADFISKNAEKQKAALKQPFAEMMSNLVGSPLFFAYVLDLTVLLVGMIGASICYLTISLSSGVLPAFIAAILTGIFTSMLWPGALILMEENVPGTGVAAYALMAAGGDMGASIAPQLMGIVIDQVAASRLAVSIGTATGLTAEQVGMKAGMLVTAFFPILGTVLLIITLRYFRKSKA